MESVAAHVGETVIIHLVLGLQPRDDEKGRVAGLEAGEALRDPRVPSIHIGNQEFGGRARALLVPGDIVITPDVIPAPDTGDGDRLSQVPGH